MSETNTPTPSPYEYPTTVDVVAVLSKLPEWRRIADCQDDVDADWLLQAVAALEAQAREIEALLDVIADLADFASLDAPELDCEIPPSIADAQEAVLEKHAATIARARARKGKP